MTEVDEKMIFSYLFYFQLKNTLSSGYKKLNNVYQ